MVEWNFWTWVLHITFSVAGFIVFHDYRVKMKTDVVWGSGQSPMNTKLCIGVGFAMSVQLLNKIYHEVAAWLF